MDDLFFSAGTTGSGGLVTVDTSRTAKSLNFEEGAITLSGGTLITLAGGGGLTVDTLAGDAIVSTAVTINGGNTFNVGASRILTLDTGAFTRGTRATLNVQGTGTVISTQAGLSTNTNLIVGPWASFNTGVNTSYAAFSGTTLGGLTYAAIPSGSQGTSSIASDVVDATGTVNYEVTAAGTLPVANINTLRYTAGTGALTPTSNNFKAAGIMNVGGGTLSIGSFGNGDAAANVVINTANGNISFTSTFHGTFVKTGPGTMTLSSSGSKVTNGWTVNEGTLSLTTSSAAGLSGNGIINSGGTFTLGVTDKIVDTATITVNSGGTFGISTFSDTTGALTLAGGSVTGTTGVLTASSYAVQSGSISAILGGTGVMTKTTSGAVTLSGNNTFTGGVTINAGAIQLGNAGALNSTAGSENAVTFGASSTGTLSLAGNSVVVRSLTTNATPGTTFVQNASAANATLTVGNSLNLASTYAGTIQNGTGSGTLALTKAGTSTLTLSGNNSYSGGTSIAAGLISVTTNGTALGTNTVTFNGGTRLTVAGGLTVANNITIGTNSGGSGNGLLMSSGAGIATYSGNITINNNAAAGGHFAGSGSEMLLSGVITSSVNVTHRAGTVIYSGGGTGYTNLDVSGTAKVGTTNGIATTATVNIGVSATGTLDLFGNNQSLVGMTKGPSAATIGNNSTASDSLLTTTGTSSYAGIIQNTLGSGDKKVALTVASGALTLSGNNTYTGATTVTNGTLAIATGYLSLTTPINVASGAFLTTSRNNTFSGGGAGQPSGVWTIAGTITQTASGSTMPASVTLTNGTMSGAFNAAFGTFLAVGSGTTITANGATNTIDAGNLGLFAGLTVNTPLATDALAISSQLGGTSALDGGLTKNGLGTVTLSGTNTYTGDTTVNAGVLAVNGTSIANTNKLVIAGGKVNLTGTETVNTLFFGGVQQPAGNYTSADLSTNFTGLGTLTVLTGPAGYSSWASINGATADRSADQDSDGVSNGVEFFIGGPTGNTTGFTPLPGVVNTAGVLSTTWTKAAGYIGVYGTDYVVETSTTLTGVWTSAALGASPGQVVITGNNVKYTFPAAGAVNFARLKVSGP